MKIQCCALMTFTLLVGHSAYAQDSTQGNQGAPIPPGSAQAPLPAENISNDLEIEDFEYDPIGKRDPFKSFIRVVKAADAPLAKTTKIVNKKKIEIEVTDPLLKYPLEGYKVLGILSNTSNPRALVEIDGKTYVMYRNMKLGRNNGVIREIREGELVVSEQIEIDGRVRQETKLLQIK
ncbi:MAG: pilus assembly protein PilP [Pseudobdellovibrionaceae bacterium]